MSKTPRTPSHKDVIAALETLRAAVGTPAGDALSLRLQFGDALTLREGKRGSYITAGTADVAKAMLEMGQRNTNTVPKLNLGD